jgi:hypothetical protein
VNPVRHIRIELADESTVHDRGGGFETTRWRVRVNDGWSTLALLAHRKSIGDVIAIASDIERELLHVGWHERQPQMHFRSRVTVMAPIGTRFASRTWTPAIDHTLGVWDYIQRGEFSVKQRITDREFEVRPRGLVAIEGLAARHAQLAAPPSSSSPPPMPVAACAAKGRKLLGVLGGKS